MSYNCTDPEFTELLKEMEEQAKQSLETIPKTDNKKELQTHKDNNLKED